VNDGQPPRVKGGGLLATASCLLLLLAAAQSASSPTRVARAIDEPRPRW